MTTRQLTSRLLLFALIAGSWACALQPIDPTQLRPAPALKTSTIYPAGQAFQSTFIATEGPHKGKTIPFNLRPTNPVSDNTPPTLWLMTFENLRESYIEKQPDGAVLITREDEYDDGVYALYDPPLVMLPATLDADKPHFATHNVVIRSLNSNEIRDYGQCTHRVETLGQQKITTAGGNFNAYLVKSTWKIKLNLANAYVEARSWLVKDHGIVKSEINKQVVLLGLLPINHIEHIEYAGQSDNNAP